MTFPFLEKYRKAGTGRHPAFSPLTANQQLSGIAQILAPTFWRRGIVECTKRVYKCYARLKMIDWTPELKRQIEDRILSGEPVVSIFRDPKLPSRVSFYRECARDSEFETAIARARRHGCIAQFDDFLALADEANAENFNAIKTRLWARSWVLAHLDPQKYSERMKVDGTIHTVILAANPQAKSLPAKELKPEFDD